MEGSYKKPLLILLTGICAAAMLFAGCGNKNGGETTAPSQLAGETPPEETLGLEVETDYFTLHYPKDWEGKVEPVRTEADGNQVITFRTTLFEQEIELFSIILGPNEAEGFLLGQLKSEKETVNVYSSVNEQSPSDWTKEQYDEICRLQEGINQITVLLYDDPRFVPNHPNVQ